MAIKYPSELPKADAPAPVKGVVAGKSAPSNSLAVQLVRKDDTALVASASAYLPEDEFSSMYTTTGTAEGNVVLAPPMAPKTLKQFATHSNVLLQCVEAMEVNIDGTGHTFVAADGKKINEDQVRKAKAFFDEPFPRTTFVKIRRELRRDLEQTGWGFIEVVRNVAGDMVGLRHIPSHTLRYCKVEAPVLVKKTMLRDGQEMEMEYYDRERKFVQVINSTTKRYYREYGASRQVHNTTGLWGDTASIEPKDRGTELMAFRVLADVDTPYGLPRWINQLPSVIGSRKAEEQNLDFFDAGAIPPTLIFISGGQASVETAAVLKSYLSGQNKNKQRAAVIELTPNAGSLDTPGTVEIKVERFGAESAKDALFASYDKDSAERVRTGFRLPPLFIGKAADYSFASAQTSYMVAEAQVFAPERTTFDGIINSTIMRELECGDVLFQSNPITIKDIATMLAALTTAKDVTDGEGWVAEVNKLSGLSLKHDAEKEEALRPVPPEPPVAGGAPFGKKPGFPAKKPAAFPPKKAKKEDEPLPE